MNREIGWEFLGLYEMTKSTSPSRVHFMHFLEMNHETGWEVPRSVPNDDKDYLLITRSFNALSENEPWNWLGGS
jgi:hypothetical protein